MSVYVYKKGDEIHVRMIVNADSTPESDYIQIGRLDGNLYRVPKEDVVAHIPKPRPFHRGERVKEDGFLGVFRFEINVRGWAIVLPVEYDEQTQPRILCLMENLRHADEDEIISETMHSAE